MAEERLALVAALRQAEHAGRVCARALPNSQAARLAPSPEMFGGGPVWGMLLERPHPFARVVKVELWDFRRVGFLGLGGVTGARPKGRGRPEGRPFMAADEET